MYDGAELGNALAANPDDIEAARTTGRVDHSCSGAGPSVSRLRPESLPLQSL